MSGFIKISESKKLIGHHVNIATQSEISIEKLAKILINQINPKAKIVTDLERIRPKNSEVHRLLGENKKLQSFTNWKPQYNIEDGLNETIKWFSKKQNIKLYKPEIYNV